MNRDIINVKDLVFQRQGRKILNDVDWRVENGEHWVITGLNGSGKTSLLKIIMGYQWATKGEVYVLDREFGKTNLPELRKSIGWVSASLDERLLSRPHDTALEVVLSGKHASIGLYDEITDKDIAFAEELLDGLHIKSLADKLFIDLSQGEKRRIAIARALMPEPELLILDEPCSGLDVYAKEQLLSTIQTMAGKDSGPTLIYVTHHLEEVVPAVTHALLLRDGQVVSSGLKKEALTEKQLSETFQIPVLIEWKGGRPWLQVESQL